MFTEEEVIKQINKKNLMERLLYSLVLLVMPGVFILMIIEIKAYDSLPVLLLIVIMGIISTFIVDYFIIFKRFIVPSMGRKNAMNDPVFKAFKTPAELVEALNKAKQAESIYELDSVKVTREYIVDYSDIRTIMRLEDITGASIGRNPKSEGDALFITDSHDRTCYFILGGDVNAARHVINILIRYSPRLRDKAQKNDSVVTEL